MEKIRDISFTGELIASAASSANRAMGSAWSGCLDGQFQASNGGLYQARRRVIWKGLQLPILQGQYSTYTEAERVAQHIGASMVLRVDPMLMEKVVYFSYTLFSIPK